MSDQLFRRFPAARPLLSPNAGAALSCSTCCSSWRTRSSVEAVCASAGGGQGEGQENRRQERDPSLKSIDISSIVPKSRSPTLRIPLAFSLPRSPGLARASNRSPSVRSTSTSTPGWARGPGHGPLRAQHVEARGQAVGPQRIGASRRSGCRSPAPALPSADRGCGRAAPRDLDPLLAVPRGRDRAAVHLQDRPRSGRAGADRRTGIFQPPARDRHLPAEIQRGARDAGPRPGRPARRPAPRPCPSPPLPAAGPCSTHGGAFLAAADRRLRYAAAAPPAPVFRPAGAQPPGAHQGADAGIEGASGLLPAAPRRRRSARQGRGERPPARPRECGSGGPARCPPARWRAAPRRPPAPRPPARSPRAPPAGPRASTSMSSAVPISITRRSTRAGWEAQAERRRKARVRVFRAAVPFRRSALRGLTPWPPLHFVERGKMPRSEVLGLWPRAPPLHAVERGRG